MADFATTAYGPFEVTLVAPTLVAEQWGDLGYGVYARNSKGVRVVWAMFVTEDDAEAFVAASNASPHCENRELESQQ